MRKRKKNGESNKDFSLPAVTAKDVAEAEHALQAAKAAYAETPHMWEQAKASGDLFVDAIMKAIKS